MKYFKKISVSEPLLNKNTKKYVNNCIESEWISSSGKYLEEFETKWANYCNVKEGIAVSNGTSALQIAFKSLELNPGDEVIMPSFTIISCATAIIEAGGKPILVDCYHDTWCLNIEEVKKRISKRTKAILVVHMFGHPAEMDTIKKISKENNLYLVEDAAEAHGAIYKKKRVGSFGDLSCFSFYANKIITTGEGGMVLTNNKSLGKKLRSLRNLSFGKKKRFYHDNVGYNYRLTNMQAAIGCSQIENIEKHIAIKRKNTFLYNKILSKMNLPLRLPSEKNHVSSVFWMYGIVIERKILKAVTLAKELQSYGIETRPLFLGMHRQPVFKNHVFYKKGNFPVTDELSDYGLYLPSGLKLKKEDILYVCKILKKIFDEKNKE